MNNLNQKIAIQKKMQGNVQLNPATARDFVKKLFATLFICKADQADEQIIEKQLADLKAQLALVLTQIVDHEHEAITHVDVFFIALENIYQKLLVDADAIYNADPAAKTKDEIFLAYPGFYAIAFHRLAHQLHTQKIPLVPRIWSEYAHSKTGIDIHPGATIGDAFVIDHGTGIVIGETTLIGNNVKIYQGVTLGALSVQKDKAAQKRHPTIQDNVVIYSGATILGGNTIIGHDSVIGGNVWLTKEVNPFSIVYHNAEVIIQDKKTFIEPLDYFI
jgi:serine O-acetyltransferase